MIIVEYIEVFNFSGALRGMRNPMNSWNKSDSTIDMIQGHKVGYEIGGKDLDLMQRLYKAGHPHRKYLRQIMVSMDITAPLYWWKEFDTYKVGTTANSCSTMHKIQSKEFGREDFSCEHLEEHNLHILDTVITVLNTERDNYNFGKLKSQWWQMIQLLPSSYNQKRTVTMNYENVFNILQYRQNHKLDEWNEFCEILIEYLPYVKEIGGFENAES